MENKAKIYENKYFGKKVGKNRVIAVKQVADLEGTELLTKYRGCGLCLAKIENGYVVDFFYVKKIEDFLDTKAQHPSFVECTASCAQLCFY